MASLLHTVASKLSRPMSRDKADTLLLLASCLLVLAPHAAHLPTWISVVCGLLLLWRVWVTFRGIRMPPTWLLAPIAVVCMAGVYWEYKRLFGQDPGVAMLVLLIAFKLLEMHAKRDLFAVVFVSFFIMLTNFFYSQSIATGLMMATALVAILTTQLSFQYTDAVPPLRKRLQFGAMILGLAVPLTVIMFVLFPRIQGPLWGLPSDAVSGRTGLSDKMTPGNISSLAQSDDVAFRVRFIDPVPAKGLLYWRGIVLGDFDGRTWTQTAPRKHAGDELLLRVRGKPIRHQVTLEPVSRRWLFALELPGAAPTMDENPAHIEHDMQLLARDPITQRVRYSVSSYVDFDLQPSAARPELQDWLRLPVGGNPRTHIFAAQLRRQSNDDAQLVNAVLRFFREEKFSYTMEPPLLTTRNSVDEFLFSTRAGFCEHYAGSFVVLMRALGIPARVVTGYQGGEINPVDGYMTVRQSDAHAWAEVWLENRGWKRIDPTAAVAPDRVEMNLRSAIPRSTFAGLLNLDVGRDSWLAQLRANVDAINNAWNQWVLNYTPDKQKSFLRSLGLDEPDWQTLTLLMFAFGAVAVAAAILPLLLQRKKVDPVRALYASLCRDLARRGIVRAIHEGPRAFAARVAATDSVLAPQKKNAAVRFLQRYEEIQYASHAKTPPHAAVSELKSLLAESR